MDFVKDENGRWNTHFKNFAIDSGIDVNCQEDALLFIYLFSGFEEWPSLFNYLVDPDPFDPGEIKKIRKAHEKYIRFDIFRDCLSSTFYTSDSFKRLCDLFNKEIIKVEKLKMNGNGASFIDDDDDDDDYDDYGGEVELPKDSLFFKFLRLFDMEEVKVRTDIVSLSIIYLSRYHINTIKSTSHIQFDATMTNEDHVKSKNWLVESVSHLQLLTDTEDKLNTFFQTYEEIDPVTFCFLAKCFYQNIKLTD